MDVLVKKCRCNHLFSAEEPWVLFQISRFIW